MERHCMSLRLEWQRKRERSSWERITYEQNPTSLPFKHPAPPYNEVRSELKRLYTKTWTVEQAEQAAHRQSRAPDYEATRVAYELLRAYSQGLVGKSVVDWQGWVICTGLAVKRDI